MSIKLQQTQAADIDFEDLKSRSDIVEVARELGMKIRKSGKTFFTVCPSHKDQTPSNCSLIPGKGAKCFRCGWSADVIGLVEVVQGVTKAEAIRWLADRAGIAHGLGNGQKVKTSTPFPKGDLLPEASQPLTPTPPTVAIVEAVEVIRLAFPEDTQVKPPTIWAPYGDGQVAANFTRDQLIVGLQAGGLTLKRATAQADQAFASRRARGLTALKPPQPKPVTPRRLSLRARVYARLLTHLQPPPSEGAIWLRDRKGITFDTQLTAGVGWLNWEAADRDLRAEFGDDLKTLGLIKVDDKTGKVIGLRFKSYRLIFPYFAPTTDGLAPVYLQARNIHATGDQLRFNKPAGGEVIPYNAQALEAARAVGAPVFICEGQTDCLTLIQSGRHAIAISGSQAFKAEWAKLFAGLKVFVTRDPDAAGEVFAKAITTAFVARGLYAPKVISLPAGQDVTDIFTGAKSKKTSEEEA